MMNFEQIILDEWLYIPLMVVAMLWSFGSGMLIGWIIVYTL